MSAPLYNTAMPIPPRRNPLSAVHHHFAVNQATSRHPPPARPTTPPKPQRQEQPKPQKSPPLPRQNAKVPPPSPPRVIVDRSRNIELMRVGMLGEVRPPSLPRCIFSLFPAAFMLALCRRHFCPRVVHTLSLASVATERCRHLFVHILGDGSHTSHSTRLCRVMAGLPSAWDAVACSVRMGSTRGRFPSVSILKRLRRKTYTRCV